MTKEATCKHCGGDIIQREGENGWRHKEFMNMTCSVRLVAEPAPPEGSGVEMIAAERERQKSVEGWTPEHDDGHACGEISMAARAYVSVASELTRIPDAVEEKWTGRPYGGWPWAYEWWKPSPDPIRNLVKAGALIAAEIDRLKRAAHKRDGGGS